MTFWNFLLIRADEADIVIGSRFKGEILEGAMIPLHRYIGNPLLTWVLNKVFGTDFSDTHSGFRAIRADSLKRLNLQSWGMEFASEMLIKASREGLTITEVPITYHPRGTPSKLSSYSDGWRHLRFILLLRPMPFLTVPGILCTLFGLVLMAAFYTSANDPDGRTHSFILGTILLTGGFQLLLSCGHQGLQQCMGLKGGRLVEKLLNYQTLEKLLVAGSVLVLAGLIPRIYPVGLDGGGIWVPQPDQECGTVPLARHHRAQDRFHAVFISMMCLNGDNPS